MKSFHLKVFFCVNKFSFNIGNFISSFDRCQLSLQQVRIIIFQKFSSSVTYIASQKNGKTFYFVSFHIEIMMMVIMIIEEYCSMPRICCCEHLFTRRFLRFLFRQFAPGHGTGSIIFLIIEGNPVPYCIQG